MNETPVSADATADDPYLVLTTVGDRKSVV